MHANLCATLAHDPDTPFATGYTRRPGRRGKDLQKMNERTTPPTSGVRSPASYQDVLDAPPHMIAELIGGALHLQPRPASPHAFAASVLMGELIGPYQRGRGGPGGWWIVHEPELHLGPDVLVPDLAGWRHATMPAYPIVPAFELVPDWICEIVSPGTRRRDLTDKRDLYGARGVGHLWLIDPIARTLEAFRHDGGVWVLAMALGDAAAAPVPPFEATTLALADLWPPAP